MKSKLEVLADDSLASCRNAAQYPTPHTQVKSSAANSDSPLRDGMKARFYHPELDSIRFFLFCGVLTFHALPHREVYYSLHHVPKAMASLLSAAIKACVCSLDVFFILSAYLITELILRERRLNGRVDLQAFYIRRLLRIWPLYFFFIALAWLWPLLDKSQATGWACVLSFLLFAGNWVMVAGGLSSFNVLAPLWSVCFEEQFYLLWPLVLRRASKKMILAVAVGLLPLASFAQFMLLHARVFMLSIWCNTLTRLDSIACGILLAALLHGRSLQIKLRTRLVLLGSGIAAWLLVGRYCGLVDFARPVPGVLENMLGYPLMSLGATAIFLSILGAPENGAPLMRYPGLVYLGKISYGLYVFHMLSLRITDKLLSKYFAVSGLKWYAMRWVCAFGIALIFAAVSFQFLEKPFLRLKRRFTYVPSGAPI